MNRKTPRQLNFLAKLFTAYDVLWDTFSQNFDFEARRNHRKNFYAHRVYESVEDSRICFRLYLKNRQETEFKVKTSKIHVQKS